VAARALWALLWTATTVIAANVGQLCGSQANWQAIARNVILHATMALIVLALRRPDLSWLPSLLYALACMTFGYSPGQIGYHWWAAIMDHGVGPTQMAVVASGYVAAATAYVLGAFGASRSLKG
jgi:hypothetical protein